MNASLASHSSYGFSQHPRTFNPPRSTSADAVADEHSSRAYILPRRTREDWVALGVMLLAACAIFFINFTASGYANEFYSAAAQAGSVSWKAFLWGSLDSGNAITVDKPPAALWLMALSVRILGLNSFAILLPEALMGVATTYLLYATVRRYWGNWAGIVTGFIFMLTPVAALMFRFNNPDALLVLLMTGATHALLRSLEYANHPSGNRKRTWWMVLAGALIGFGFLTKQLQVLLVLPGFALAFLLASPTGMVRRILDSLAAIGSMIVAAGWWVLLTVVVPAGDRPYIGGSQRNSFLELTFGYNGFGRLTGSEEGSVIPGHGHEGGGMPAGGGRGGGMWGQTGLNRLFSGEFGTQISWLAPLAFAGIVISLLVIGRAVRTDVRRANVIAFGGWLTVTWLVFSFYGRHFPPVLHRGSGSSPGCPGGHRCIQSVDRPGQALGQDRHADSYRLHGLLGFQPGRSVPVASLAQVGHSHNRSHGRPRFCTDWTLANTTTRSCSPHCLSHRAYGWPCCMDAVHRIPRTYGINRFSRTQP